MFYFAAKIFPPFGNNSFNIYLLCTLWHCCAFNLLYFQSICFPPFILNFKRFVIITKQFPFERLILFKFFLKFKMAKTCYFPFLFLTYFFLSSALFARSDDRYVYSESASKYVRPNANDEQQLEKVQSGKAQDGVAATVNNGPWSRSQSSLSVEEAEEGEVGSQSRLKRTTPPEVEAAPKVESTPGKDQTKDDTAVVAHKISMLQKSESSETLMDKIGTLITIFALHPSRYISTMKDLFHLYNNKVDITKDGFSYGSISLHMQFHKHTSSEDIATLNTVFYAHHTEGEDERKVERANGEHLINLNVDELLEKNALVNGRYMDSFGESEGNATSDAPTNVYQAIKDSQLDATKFFITLDKVGEEKLAVSKLDDFLGECLKSAQDALAQPAAADKKEKKKAGNLQSGGEVSGGQANGSQASGSQSNGSQASGSQASGSQASGSQASANQANKGQKKAQKAAKTRKALMEEFKQSLVSKDMAACKEAAKLLMASSTVSSLMYLFVLVALGIYLL
ncbi:PIMMS43 protein, putative [Plasmodium vivax]|nr:PIMMS43 protein, putative [Plasmodium vivax]